MSDQHIHFITTGGTIDKDYEAGRGVRNFVIGEPAVERMLDTVGRNYLEILGTPRCRNIPRTYVRQYESLTPPPNFEYSVESPVRKDTLDLDDDDRAAIAAACEGAPSSRIVITHGTDTIVDTARELPEGPTIVLILSDTTVSRYLPHGAAKFFIDLCPTVSLVRSGHSGCGGPTPNSISGPRSVPCSRSIPGRTSR
ncbi:hypothetical protein [Halobellus marinus]|uniref:hypothetical protein n=1 Tax=Halobellus TaxID=1073986 RepID=UPI0028AA6BD5|nr:hypothetical protein [Halobellus sp. DFY28]